MNAKRMRNNGRRNGGATAGSAGVYLILTAPLMLGFGGFIGFN